MASSDLNKANEGKKDEFYTQLVDIQAELKHYEKHFKGKVVFCNCDDACGSDFFKYFALNFNYLGLKKLIATCYRGSPFSDKQLSIFGILPKESEDSKKAYKIEISEVRDIYGEGLVDFTDVAYLLRNRKNILTFLDGDGDFRSEECVEMLKETDIICTAPPLSLFREFVAQLMKYKKYFLIIGNVSVLWCKKINSLIKSNEIWLGCSIHSGDREFLVPDDYPFETAGYRVDEQGRKYIRVKGVRWFTNLDCVESHTDFDFGKTYASQEYLKRIIKKLTIL